jgi:Tol biopolymer transport system component/DNA-binding winged helix-turn-helix (wHTH) protein
LNRDDPDNSSSPSDLRRPFQVGEWEAHPELNRLTREERTIGVEPRVMQVLVCLASRPGEVWTRDDLLDEVWGDVVIQEEALTHAISRLRRAFGDSARDSKYIETIPKRGYRLVAAVGGIEERPETAPTDHGVLPSAPPPRTLSHSGMIGVLLLVALAIWGVARTDFSEGEPAPRLLEGTPLTSYPGQEHTPALSPDGTRVAFTWDGESEGARDLYVKQLDAQKPLRLTETAEPEYSPRWSPDGSELLYQRDAPDLDALLIISSTGGEPRSVLERSCSGGIGGADWDPSGRTVVVSIRDSIEEPWVLHRLSLETGALEEILTPPAGSFGDRFPACSPTGSGIAFERRDSVGHSDLYYLSNEGETPRRLTFNQGNFRGLAWTADGEGIVFSSGTAFAGEFRLWMVDLVGGDPCWLPTRGHRSIYPTIAGRSGTLVYVEETYRRRVVEAELDPEPGSEQETTSFAPSSHSEYDAHFSPDGKRVVFVSTRSGSPEIYVADRDGGGIRQLTDLGGSNPEFIHWSRDGRHLAFEMMSGERLAVHLTDVERGLTRTLTQEDHDEILLSWALDGEAIYLRILEAGKGRVERVAVETGITESTFSFDAYMLAESPGDGLLYYVPVGTTEVWRTTDDPELPERVLAFENGRNQCYWGLDPEGVLFYRRGGEGLELALHDFKSDERRAIFSVAGGNPGRFDLSPDRRFVLYDQVDHIAKDLIRVDAFAGGAER